MSDRKRAAPEGGRHVRVSEAQLEKMRREEAKEQAKLRAQEQKEHERELLREEKERQKSAAKERTRAEKDSSVPKETARRMETARSMGGKPQGGSERMPVVSRRVSRARARLRLAAGIALLLVLLLLANFYLPTGLLDSTRLFFAGLGTGSGFPVSVAAPIEPVRRVGNDILVLTDTTTFFYQTNGRCVVSRQHGFSTPACAVSENRALIFDRGGTGLRVENRYKTLLTMNTQQPIIAAAIAADGTFAVATRSDSYACEVTVYNADGKGTYVWYSAEQTAVTLSLSSRGTHLAVGTLNASGGQFVSGLYLFDLGQTAPVASTSYAGAVMLSVVYGDGGAVAVLDQMASFLDESSGTRTDCTYDSDHLTAFSADQNGVALLLNSAGTLSQNRLLVVDRHAEKRFAADIGEEATAVSAGGSRICVLGREQLLFFTDDGENAGSQAVSADISSIAAQGYTVALLGAASVGLAKD